MIGELALMAALGYGGWRLAKRTLGSLRQPHARHDASPAAVAAAQRRYAERQRQQRRAAVQRQAAARNMQLALLQLRQAPDFRRAAGHAELARNVPLAFRQRQFRRFRPQLVASLAERLQAGASTEQAAAGLRELVTALGLASYEAEYIIAEAQDRQAATPLARTSFADRVRQSQTEYQRRVETIQNLADLDPELREQLLELEQQRLREQLLAETEGERAPELGTL